jgi:N-carbamoyl-L-amino-acid hydrolase
MLIDAGRLWRRHEALAKVGATPDGGVDRQGFSRADGQARALLAGWAAQRGFAVSIDPIGNLFIRRDGRDAGPVILTGSHIDSQPDAGRFDGSFGILAGFEVLETLEDGAVYTSLPIELVVWSNEEGSRFAPGCMGSMCFTGASVVEDFLDVRDADGVPLTTALDDIFAATPGATRRGFGPPPAAFIEAHIEQGPVLERSGKTIGVVCGVQGARWYDVEVVGEPAHAGTAPMACRRDALREAVAMIAGLQANFHDPMETLLFTVGRIHVFPNIVNRVPDRVKFSIDLRHPEIGALERLGKQIEPLCQSLARRCRVTVDEVLRVPPCKFDPWVVTLIGRQAAELGLASMVLHSGAFHDAVQLAGFAPSGMVFVPNAGGVTHNPAESATAEDLAAGCQVLARTLIALAG